ncbi:MAG: 50S ribosomal protein L29 [Candidatus Hydrogenedentota bacterium]
MKANQLRELTGEELLDRLEDRQKAVLSFRLAQATEVVENVRAAREARREIARIKTVLRERERAAEKGTQ